MSNRLEPRAVVYICTRTDRRPDGRTDGRTDIGDTLGLFLYNVRYQRLGYMRKLAWYVLPYRTVSRDLCQIIRMCSLLN